MNLIRLFTQHPNAANLVMGLLLGLGLFSALNLTTRFWPPAAIAEVEVRVSWPGASAEDVSENILVAIEPAVRFLSGVESIRSYARDGSAFTAIEFEAGTNMDRALSDVEQAVDAITTLPEDAERPTIRTDSLRDPVAKLGVAGPFPEAALQLFARRIRDDLLAAGLDNITMRGVRERELIVDAREHDLIRLGLTTADIAAAIRGNTLDRPSGVLDGEIDRQIRVLAGEKTPDDIAAIKVKSLPDGTTLRVSDVADVSFGFARGAVAGLRGGDPAVEMILERAQNADALQSERTVRDYIAKVGPEFPQSLKIQLYDVRTERLWDRISILVRNGWQGLAIVLIVLFVFLEARIAFWVALGIPVAFGGTLAVMLATGQTINMISLFALIMMLGVIVDDAIVVGEHADTLQSRGLPLDEAAERGATEMFVPVMASSLTTIASFGPIFLMTGVMGQFMQAMPLVAIAIIVASVIECFLVLPGHLAHAWGRPSGLNLGRFLRLTVLAGVGAALIALALRLVLAAAEGAPWASAILSIPPLLTATVLILVGLAAAGLFERRLSRRAGRPSRRSPLQRFRAGFDRTFNAFRDGPFTGFVGLTYAFRYTTLAVAIGATMVVLIGLYFGGGHIRFVFFPSPEAEFLNARIEFHAGIPRERVIAGTAEVEAALARAAATLAPSGEAVVSDAYALIGRAGRDRGDNLATLAVQLAPSEARTVRTRDLTRTWQRTIPAIPGVKNVSVSERRGGPPSRDVDVKLSGAPPSALKAAGADIIAALERTEGVLSAEDDLPLGKPEVVMQLTPRGEALGFTLDSIGQQVRGAFEGEIARRLAIGEDDVPIRVRQRAGGEAIPITELFLRAPASTGGDTPPFVPLTEVVDLSERSTFTTILRRDGAISVSVIADVDDTVTTPQLVAESLAANVIPVVEAKYGVRAELGGREQDRRRNFGDLRKGLYLALFFIYITLAFVFGSYWRPVAIMLVIPFGAVGAVLGHAILGMNLTIVSFVGLLGLTGILVNDSIILVRRFDERLAAGEAPADAAKRASADRLRAVLLTSLTTIGGLVPLLFETSISAQFLLPMAVTIVFGLSVATALVLILVPTFIGIAFDIGRTTELLLGRRTRDPALGPGETPAQ